MTFPADHISEPRASLLVVCMRSKFFVFVKFIEFVAKFMDLAYITSQAYREDNR